MVLFHSMVYATLYTFNSSGDWTIECNWDFYQGTTIDSGDELIITESLTVNSFIALNGYLEVSDDVTMTIDWPINISNTGSITNNGEIINNTQTNLFGEC